VVKTYVDGCSMVYGHGLAREYSLAHLINADVDMSRPGKSNMGIAIDLIENIDKYDKFVIGFTYPNRYSFFDTNRPIDVHPSLETIRLSMDSEYIESDVYPKFFQMLWMLTDESKLYSLSSFIVQSTISLLEKMGKESALFSWHQYPGVRRLQFSAEFKLPDSHLNEKGMEKLANYVTNYDKK
jgi:hypothetical protein